MTGGFCRAFVWPVPSPVGIGGVGAACGEFALTAGDGLDADGTRDSFAAAGAAGSGLVDAVGA
ncbi:MAG: hypothetical protein N2C12_09750, partial [Planctomycetales bacterium]